MISKEDIQAAVDLLARDPAVDKVIIFGSQATGEAREDSDLDLLVIETDLASRHSEMVRLRACLRPLGIPVDVLVIDAKQFEIWKEHPGTAIHEAAHQGQVAYERAG